MTIGFRPLRKTVGMQANTALLKDESSETVVAQLPSQISGTKDKARKASTTAHSMAISDLVRAM